jgi:hypothetical protein
MVDQSSTTQGLQCMAGVGLTEAQANAERRRDGDGGWWCFGDREGVRE